MEPSIRAEKDVPALSFLENKSIFSEEPFRVINAKELKLDVPISHYYLTYNLEGLYGYDGTFIWIPEYVVALQSGSPLKTRGIFNAKYIISPYSVNTTSQSGLKLVFESNESCRTCKPEWAGGPFVYENEYALSRASFFKKAILVVGDREKLITNSILSHSDFYPQKTLVVEESNINHKNFSELNRYEAIILANFNMEDLPKEDLLQYQKAGGKIFPNVINQSTNQKYNLSSLQNQIGKLMNTSKSQMFPVKHLVYKNNERVYDIKNLSNGFLVLSEKFYMFPNDWKESEGRTLLKTDGGISAIWIDSSPPKTITLKYYPATLNIGLLMMALAILWIIILLFLQKVYAEKITALFSEESESGKSPP